MGYANCQDVVFTSCLGLTKQSNRAGNSRGSSGNRLCELLHHGEFCARLKILELVGFVKCT